MDQVLYDDPVETDLLMLRYPPILQFALDQPSLIDARRVVIVANQAPSELDGSDVRYLVPDCTDNAREMFVKEPIWAPQGPQVREALSPYLSESTMTPFDLVGIIDREKWFHKRTLRKSQLPVIGRHSRDNAMKWPEDLGVIKSVYPIDGTMDVRVLGGARSALPVLGQDVYPAAWTVYPTDALSAAQFLQTLDYYVFFQNERAVEAFELSGS